MTALPHSREVGTVVDLSTVGKMGAFAQPATVGELSEVYHLATVFMEFLSSSRVGVVVKI